jgi:predicted Fe-Mo cluster-binding NifX family protein
MKISLCAKEGNLDSMVDERFARTKYFIIYDTETKDFKVLENSADDAHGAGPKAIQMLADEGVSVIIAPSLGKNAQMAAEGANMKVVEQINSSVKNNIENFLKG